MAERGPIRAGLLAGAVAGALLLIAAELTPLFTIHVSSAHGAVRSVSAGSHDSYALVPVAILALGLGYGASRAGSRFALLCLGVLGTVALLLGLLRDLPDARRGGLLPAGPGRYAEAAASPGAGLYLETLGAVVLILTSVSGFILIGPPRPAGGADRPAGPPRERLSREG